MEAKEEIVVELMIRVYKTVYDYTCVARDSTGLHVHVCGCGKMFRRTSESANICSLCKRGRE